MQGWVNIRVGLLSGTNAVVGFEQDSYTLDDINWVFVIVEQNGIFQVLPPPAIASNNSQTQVAELGTSLPHREDSN
jgi:hypothetical protein